MKYYFADAEALHRRGVPVYAIGINHVHPVNTDELLVRFENFFLFEKLAEAERLVIADQIFVF